MTARSLRPLCSYWEWRLPPDASHMWSGLIKPFPPSLAGQLWFMLSNSRPRPQSLLTLHPVLLLPFSHLAPLFTSLLISCVLFVYLSSRFSLQKYFLWLLKNGICVDAAGSAHTHKHWARLSSQDWAVLSEEETRAPREDWRVNIATALRHPWGSGECLLS